MQKVDKLFYFILYFDSELKICSYSFYTLCLFVLGSFVVIISGQWQQILAIHLYSVGGAT